MEKLVGQELLAMLDHMQDCSKADQAKAAGYIRVLDDGTQKADFTSLYSAILAAKEQVLESHEEIIQDNLKPETDLNSLEYWLSLGEDNLETVLSIGISVPPPQLIVEYSTSTNSSIRASIAGLSVTPDEVLRRLLEDSDCDVRDAAAISIAKKLIGEELINSTLESFLSDQRIDDILADQLFKLNSDEVRLPLARNPFLGNDLIFSWSQTDIDDWLKDILELNLVTRKLPDSYKGLDEPTVIQLIKTEFPDDETVKSLIVLYRDSYADHQENLCLYLAESNKITPTIQAYLIEKGDTAVKQAIALNPAATMESLNQLSRDTDFGVRRLVAANRNVTNYHLELLAQDPVESVRAAASLRLLPADWQNLSSEMLQNKLRAERIAEEILGMFIHENDSDILISIAGNPCITEKIQKRLSADFDQRVVSELVLNPATSEAILKRISKSWSNDQTVQAAISKRLLPPEIVNLEESDLIKQIEAGNVATKNFSSLFEISSRSVRHAILNCSLLGDSEKRLILDGYYSRVYPSGWPADKLFTEMHKKGWIIMAVPFSRLDVEGKCISKSEKHDIAEVSKKLVTLASETKSCWSASFVYEGYHACSPVFYVADQRGDCLLSLVDRESQEEPLRAMLSCNLEEILMLASANELDRVFTCIAFTYREDDANIEIEDLKRELSVDDNEPFVNFPSLSKQFEEGLEVYLKPHPSHGDSKIVSFLCWEDGELVEEDEVQNKMSPQLKDISLGNPFEIFYL